MRKIFCVTVLGAISTLSALAQTQRLPLIPQPREFQSRSDISLAHGLSAAVRTADKEDAFAVDDLLAYLKEQGVARSAAVGARLYLLHDTSVAGKRALEQEKIAFDKAMDDEGYVLFTTKNAIYVVAHTGTGIFYGAQTAKQLVSGSGTDAVIHGAVIRDWPAMKWRGVHDDLSRGPFPTLEFQKKQIRTFAAYKLNTYSPYFEHTMQYSANPLPALPGGSMSKQDAEALVEYAKQYHVTIVPEQEAFGHLHHVLTLEQYAPLAEVPSGSVLAPGDPGSIKLIGQWFTELASIFPGPFLHIGADETFELGQGRTAEEVKQRGLGAVYIDFLTRIHQELEPLHKRLLFWGDIAMHDPPLVKNLPKDMIAVAWEYSPQDDFNKWLDPYTQAGLETWVAPGVNNWSQIYPNNDMALRNIRDFVATGQKAGSSGMLNTIWDDDGEGLFAQDWYGILFGATAAWQSGTSDIDTFAKNYGPTFHGDTTGDLSQAQQIMTSAFVTLNKAGLGYGTDSLFWIDPWSAAGQATAAKIKPILPELRTDAERALTLIAQARNTGKLREIDAVDALELGARRLDFIAFKFQTAPDMASEYVRIYETYKSADASKVGPRELYGLNGRCLDLRMGYGYLEDFYSSVWLKENRPYFLNNITTQYNMAMQLWTSRAEKLRGVRQQWTLTHTLPTPESLGIAEAPKAN